MFADADTSADAEGTDRSHAVDKSAVTSISSVVGGPSTLTVDAKSNCGASSFREVTQKSV